MFSVIFIKQLFHELNLVMGKNIRKGLKANVFKVAGAKSLKKSKAKKVNLGLKNTYIETTATSRYHRQPGIRRSYIDYTKTQLEECLAAIRAKQLTQRDAADFYKIPCSTIKYKLANKSNKNPGRQPTFTDQEEALFVEHISKLSECGFSFTNLDIKMVIRDYLNSQNRIVPLFRNNMPGKDWLKSFIERHESLYRRRVNDRAHVSEVSITDFLKHASKTIENVEVGNIYTYDEISFGDDPLKNTNIWRRETKYPEIKTSACEAGFTVMFCGNAEGEVIPPFIISKSEHRCSTWAENGPDGASYDSTKYGWINVKTFENWFLNHLLPILRKKKGRKVLIGDSLSSHISLKVLSSSEKHNIRFMCLPPNAIHVLQPLEYVYYQPLQQIWCELLLSWKIFKIKGSAATTMKADFPCLLRAALDLLPDIKQNLVKGFKDTGIYPLNLQEPLNKLNKIRITNTKKRKLERRQYYFDQSGHFSEAIEDGSYSWLVEAQTFKKEPYNSHEDASSSMSDKDWQASTESTNDVCLVVVNGDDILLVQFQQSHSPKNLLNVMFGDHVIVTRESCIYPGRVLGTGEEGAFVHCMKRRNFFWCWPSDTNIQYYDWEKVLCKIAAPKIVQKGHYSVPELV